MSTLRNNSFIPSIVFFLIALGFQMIGYQSLPIAIFLWTLAVLFTLIPLWTWLESKDARFVRKLLISGLAIVIVFASCITYYIKGIYIKRLENRSQQLSQLTPEQIEEKIKQWLLNTKLSVTKVPDKDVFFRFYPIETFRTRKNEIKSRKVVFLEESLRKKLFNHIVYCYERVTQRNLF